MKTWRESSRMPETLVVNASPLIFLGNGDWLELLRSFTDGEVIVPEVVLEEILSGGHHDRAAEAVRESSWLQAAAPESMPPEVLEWDLGPGESAVIAISLEIGARPVIDDLSGRRCARAFDLDVIGTLGLVIAAHHRGAIDDPRMVLLELRDAGMWLSDEVIERALQSDE